MVVRRLVLAAACVAAASLFIPPTSSARTLAEARAVCPDGKICLFEHARWEGDKRVAARHGISYLSDFGFNDLASSYVSDARDRTFCLFEDESGLFESGGASIEVGPGDSDPFLTRGGWNDRISSIHRPTLFGDCA